MRAVVAALGVLSMCSAVLSSPALAEAPLSLSDAERMALARDPLIEARREQVQALQERAVAEGQLPDPQLKFGLMNFPTDTFARDQEAMTQVQLGVQQMFPRGSSLKLKEKRTRAFAEGARSQMREQDLLLRKTVRRDWLDAYYWVRAGEVLRANRDVFEELVQITEVYYASGRRQHQDVTRAELELGLLEDRLVQTQSMEEAARARLAKWIGAEAALRPLPETLPGLPAMGARETLRARLADHPLMDGEDAQVLAGRLGVDLARQDYKPGWMVDVTYGFRDGQNPNGTERADFLSAMVSVDIPLFTGKRQDRRLAASRHELGAARNRREERLLQLTRMLDESWVTSTRLAERLDRFDTYLLPKAHENAQAALHDYQSEVGDFTTLMRARIHELDTRLKALRLRVDLAKTQADLLYLQGEEQ